MSGSTLGRKRERFSAVFEHFGAIALYAQRRGSRDPEGIASEAMAIAWRRLERLNDRDALPWLIATARNLLFEEYRRGRRVVPMDPVSIGDLDSRQVPDFEIESTEPRIDRALSLLSPDYREALLLVAWEELTPTEAAAALGIRPSTFRMRLLRARRRFEQEYGRQIESADLSSRVTVEEES